MVITLDYRYPIWSFLHANLFVSLGNVFNGRLANLSFKRMVMCWGLGVRTITSREVSFDLLVAFGTNQLQEWDNNFTLDDVHVMFGINQGF